jgi:hypothetical protein
VVQKLTETGNVPGCRGIRCDHSENLALVQVCNPAMQHHHGLRADQSPGIHFVVPLALACILDRAVVLTITYTFTHTGLLISADFSKIRAKLLFIVV